MKFYLTLIFGLVIILSITKTVKGGVIRNIAGVNSTSTATLSTISTTTSAISSTPTTLQNSTLNPPASPNSPSSGSGSKVIAGFFPNWLYAKYPVSQIPFKKYTHIIYAFALEVSGNTPTWSDNSVLEESNSNGFPKLVRLATAAGTKVIVSIGGWSGGVQFSAMSSSASTRASFIQWCVNFVSKYYISGINIDWEYPTAAGAGCNTHSNNDVDNLLVLVTELRNAFDKSFPSNRKEISLAVHITPWGGASPTTSVSQFVSVVDYFYVMAFDINGAWNPTSGPNAPFNTEQGKGYAVGFTAGIKSWNAAGVPYSKIVGGVPFYGRSQTLTVTSNPSTQYNSAVTPKAPHGDSDDGPWTDAYCAADSSQNSGIWKYKNLISQGVLTSPTVAAPPWIRSFDNITQTPWLYNPTTKDYISYDDPTSISVKTKWAISQGLGGLFCWSLDQDNGDLIDVMQELTQGNTQAKDNGIYISVTLSIFSEKHSTITKEPSKSNHSTSPTKLAHR